jgi:hypothetical protein
MSKAKTLAGTVSTGGVLATPGSVPASAVTGLATVATTGSYNDLTNKPTITTTATNLAGGSAGTIPYQSASGTTQMLAVGTAGQVLQTNGAGAPSWVTAAGGSMRFISAVTTTGATEIEFLSGISSTYDTYLFEIVGLYRPGGGTTQLLSQLYSAGAYVAGSSYVTHTNITNLGSTPYVGLAYSNQANAKLTNTASIPGSSNANAYNGWVKLTGVNVGRANLRSEALSNGDNALIDSNTNIYADTIRGIKFFLAAGTMDCTIRMYGISKT